MAAQRKDRRSARLPAHLRAFFWEYRFEDLRWPEDRETVIGRVLAAGDWRAVRWLRSRAGDEAIREWIERRRGGGLSPQQLRFWEIILGLPHRRVSAWLRAPGRQVWDRRISRCASTRKS